MNTYTEKDLDLFRDKLSLLFFDFHEHFLKDFNKKLESHLGFTLKEFAMNSDIDRILDSPRVYFSDGREVSELTNKELEVISEIFLSFDDYSLEFVRIFNENENEKMA